MQRTIGGQTQRPVQLDLFGYGGASAFSPAVREFGGLGVDRARRVKPVLVASNSLSLRDHNERCGYGDGADNQNDREG